MTNLNVSDKEDIHYRRSLYLRVSIFLFSAGILLLPFTQLRFFYVGPGEAMIAVASLLIFVGLPFRLSFAGFPFLFFWLLFLLFSLLGLVVERVLSIREEVPVGLVVFDAFSYFFVILSVYSMERLLKHAPEVSLIILRRTFWHFSFFILFLFLLSRFGFSFGGYSLLYNQHFSPLAVNLHQVASVLVVYPFLGLFFVSVSMNRRVRLLAAVLSLVMTYVALQTGSFKAVLCIIFGFSFLALGALIRVRSLSFSLALVAFAVVLLSFVIQYFSLFDKGLVLFYDEDKGGARESMWSYAMSLDWFAYIFGLGPGPHVLLDDGYHDAHQTMLTVLLQGGFISVLALLALMMKIFSRASVHPALFASVGALLPYILGGDILRRLPIWLLLILIYCVAREAYFSKKVFSDGK